MEYIFDNGRIYTQAGRIASAIAVSGCRIAAVGSNDEICRMQSEKTKRIDLKGRCVVPGFTDSHCHVLYGGLAAEQLSLRETTSICGMIREIQAYIKEKKLSPGTWILASGYDHNIFPEGRHPDVKDLDAVSEEHPILIERVCGHIGAANSLALALTGFDREQVFPGGGRIERGPDTKPNGILVETVLDRIKDHLPKPTVEESARAIRRIFAEASSYGVTSMHTDDVAGSTLETVMSAYQRVKEEGKATVRIWEEVQAPRIPDIREFLKKGFRTGDGDRFFRIGNIKLITDGSLGARTALMSQPYNDDPVNTGVQVYTQEELNEVVRFAHLSGMQVACHAIGDGAAAQCAAAMSAAYRSDGRDLRNRIVHCQFVNDSVLSVMREGHVCADVQPAFLASDLPMIHSRTGSRDSGGYAWKSLMDNGILLGGGSDSPVETFNPIWGIHCAVNRTDAGGLPDGGWHADEKLTVEEAVRMYTVNGAFLSLEEEEKGTLETGKLADFVVLDRDIYEIDPTDIKNTRVVMTIMDGKIVFHNPVPA